MVFNTEQEFQKIADLNGWSFVYGRKDHQNLLTGALKELETIFNRDRNIDTILYCRERSTDLDSNVKVEIILGNYTEFNEDHTLINEKHILPSKRLVKENIINVLNNSHNVSNVFCTDKINVHDVNVSGAFASFNIEYFEYEC